MRMDCCLASWSRYLGCSGVKASSCVDDEDVEVMGARVFGLVGSLFVWVRGVPFKRWRCAENITLLASMCKYVQVQHVR